MIAPVKRPHQPSPSTRAFRPRLEVLEERAVPNASRVFDGSGQLNLFIVQRNAVTGGGDLYRYDNSGGHFLLGGASDNVLSVHAFKAPAGQIGFDVVFASQVIQGKQSSPIAGAWVEYDSSGSHFMGGGYRTAAAAYDNLGHKTIDVVTTDGTWIEYDNASPGGRIMGVGVTEAVTTFDPLGRKTIDVVYSDFGSQSKGTVHGEWVVYDAAGSHDMGGGGAAVGAPDSISSVGTTF